MRLFSASPGRGGVAPRLEMLRRRWGESSGIFWEGKSAGGDRGGTFRVGGDRSFAPGADEGVRPYTSSSGELPRAARERPEQFVPTPIHNCLNLDFRLLSGQWLVLRTFRRAFRTAISATG